jgi:hypothetical protein
MTAVEWFLTELKRMQYFIGNDMLEAYNQALEMERCQKEKMYTEEELREAFRQGQDNMQYSKMYGLDSKLTEQEWFENFQKK